MKRFGKGARGKTAVSDEFELVVVRDGVDEIHTFKVEAKVTAGELTTAVAAQAGRTGEALSGVLRMIRRNLCNTDGVPAQWSVSEIPVSTAPVATPAEGEWPAEGGDLSEPTEPGFRGPDGQIYLMSDADAIAKFTDPLAGSSRRRWNHLLDEDEDAEVQAEDLVQIAEWMIGLAANHPSAPSRS